MNIITKLRKTSKEKYWDYFILIARILLAYTFISYGYGKLTGTQFGVSPEVLNTPLKDVSLLKIAWHLFSHQPFKAFIGISQIICGVLLIINRTVILGAFLFLPIVVVILVIDLTIIQHEMAMGFAWRLSSYIILDLLILWYYKDKMKIIWDAVWNNTNTKFKFPVWTYLLLPIMAISLEISLMLPKVLVSFITNPTQFINGINSLFSNF